MTDVSMDHSETKDTASAAEHASTVKDGVRDGKPLGSLPNYGTVQHAKAVDPSIPCATDMASLFEEYKAYKLLRKKDEMNSNCEPGVAAYIVPVKWLKAYHEWLMYDQFEQGVPQNKLKMADDHFTKMNPGQMNHAADLLELDDKCDNIYGSDRAGKGFEAEYLDMYIDTKHNSQTQSYFIFGEELFKFIHSRYGGTCIKRYYVRKSNAMYTQVEVHLQQIRA